MKTGRQLRSRTIQVVWEHLILNYSVGGDVDDSCDDADHNDDDWQAASRWIVVRFCLSDMDVAKVH